MFFSNKDKKIARNTAIEQAVSQREDNAFIKAMEKFCATISFHQMARYSLRTHYSLIQ
jgi:methyl-accepting chemotaxis protein